MKNILNPRTFTITAIILVGAFSRLIPHPPNFTPMISMAIFGGIMLSDKKASMLIPLSALFISDLFLGFHSTMYAVYISFIAIVFLSDIIVKQPKLLNVAAVTIISSVLFFAVTNFGSWLSWNMYPKTLTGLLLSYEAAIPFFRNSLFSSLLFSGVFFGAYSLIENFQPKWLREEWLTK